MLIGLVVSNKLCLFNISKVKIKKWTLQIWNKYYYYSMIVNIKNSACILDNVDNKNSNTQAKTCGRYDII